MSRLASLFYIYTKQALNPKRKDGMTTVRN